MRTKTQLLMLTIVGNLLIAAIFLGLSEFRAQKQQAASLGLGGTISAGLDTMANDAFAQGVGAWHPQTGNLEKRDIWNEIPLLSFLKAWTSVGLLKTRCSTLFRRGPTGYRRAGSGGFC